MRLKMSDSSEKLECPACKKSFFRNGLDKHLEAKHPNEWAERQKELDSPVSCMFCNLKLAKRDLRKHLNQAHHFSMFAKKKGKPYLKSKVEQRCECCGITKVGTFVYGTNPKNAKHICTPCRKIVFKNSSDDRDALDFAVFSSFESNRRRH